MKKKGIFLSLLLVFVLYFTMFGNIVSGAAQNISSYLVSVYDTEGSGLDLRAAADVYSTSYLKIPDNTMLTISQVSGSYGLTSYNGISGWVYLKHTLIIGDYTAEAPTYGNIEPTYYTVYNTLGEGLEMRCRPTVESSTFGPIYDGAIVLVEAIVDDDWAYVYYNGRYGWCRMWYLTVSASQQYPYTYVPTYPTYTYDPAIVQTPVYPSYVYEPVTQAPEYYYYYDPAVQVPTYPVYTYEPAPQTSTYPVYTYEPAPQTSMYPDYTYNPVTYPAYTYDTATQTSVTESATEVGSGDNVNQVYLRVLQDVETDARQLEALRVGKDLMLGNVIIADVIGDSTLEIIYSTIEYESGEAAINTISTLNYSKKAVVHLVTYDSSTQRVYDAFDFDAIAINEVGEFTHFGLWTADYYTVDDYPGFYYSSNVNASGTFSTVTEYQYGMNSKRCEETYTAVIDKNGLGQNNAITLSDITNPAARIVAGNPGDPSVKLLVDAYGYSDYKSMTYDEALRYFGGSPQSAAQAPVYTYEEILAKAQLVMYRYNEMEKHAGCASLALENAPEKIRSLIGQEIYQNYGFLPDVSRVTDCHTIDAAVEQRKEYFSDSILDWGYGDATENFINNLTEYDGNVYVTWYPVDWNLYDLDTLSIISFDNNGVNATCYREIGGQDILYTLYFTYNNGHLKLMSEEGSF